MRTSSGRVARDRSGSGIRCALFVALAIAAAGPATAGSDTHAIPTTPLPAFETPPPVSSRPPGDALALAPEQLARLPGAADPEIRAAWRRASDLEAALRLDEAADAYRALIPRLPGSAAPYWRVARAEWRIGDGTPRDDGEGKLLHYGRAAEWSERGIALDPGCAECMLWHYAALGRLTMTEGVLSGLRRARTMERLLDRAIALEPHYRDNDWNSTLGNLYYARAIWNRMVPEWWFLPLVAGVKGDKRQALEDIEHAVALHPDRIDYRVEKGAILLCLGTDRGRPETVAAGRSVLRDALALEPRLESDPQDLALARVLLQEPEKSCGYSREGFVDLDDVKGRL
jgi:tetratricopeptide (TPR) repeat protein